ncbi:protein TIFY 6a-like [Lolium rigidum]|uniref:protein TIFY 6a-like n=1 Tax=Lolium rigidum TaxID=89674 RepID=UPI001F5CEC4D|nr:protein TIFY 6a-like [Lolium rigidum]
MERDFLGAIGRTKEEPEMEDAGGGKPESDYLGGAAPPATQWQYQAKAGATPAFMSFRPAAEGTRDSFSAFRQQQQQPAVVTPHHHQSQFGFDGRVSPQQYAAAVAHAHGVDSYDVPARHHLGVAQAAGSRPFHHPMQLNPGNPMLRVQSLPSVAAGAVPFKNQYLMMNSPVPSSTVGVYGPRDLRNPEATRMTIFYNGAVNVFDVPMEKAHELLVQASRASIIPSTMHKSDSPVSADARFAAPEVSLVNKIAIQKSENFVPRVPAISSPVPIMPQPAALSKSTSSSNNESAGPTSSGVPSAVPPASQASTAEPLQQAISAAAAAAVTPRAVPQARKASLARFLEKRKERVSTVVPYPSSKSPLDSSDSAPSKSSGTDVALSTNNGQEPASIGLSRNISFSSNKVPSTDLQI